MASALRNINNLLYKGLKQQISLSSSPLKQHHSLPARYLHLSRGIASLNIKSNHFLQGTRADNPILANSQPTLHSIVNNQRQFHTSNSLNCSHKDGKEVIAAPEKKPTFGEQMSLRLINENGFLSWTRNSYLASAVAATILNGTNEALVQEAGLLVLVISAMNMAWGSGCHLNNLLRIQDRIAMSKNVLYLNLLGTVVHALLWFVTLAYFLHRYAEVESKNQEEQK